MNVETFGMNMAAAVQVITIFSNLLKVVSLPADNLDLRLEKTTNK
jgi:hypothetical protein